ncbi:MAG: Rieske 2Fe-2S domain-containing protein [Deltaproteobacteria bacterium]|nr:Rieske 2Fe-2S domain-containing protein [Deltaproteobacteria bacterium]
MDCSVARLSELPIGRPVRVTAEGHAFAVVRTGHEVHVLDDECPHRGASLGQGTLEGGALVCPLHRWSFRISTGRGLGIAASTFVRRFDSRVDGDEVIVDLPVR